MISDTPLDYAVFQLSPRRSRCELFVSSAGNTEKLASGLVKPFVSHLKVVEEQVALAVQSIKLEVERHSNAATWFTKETLERFVRFVSTPEVLELVNTFYEEMSQLEAARSIYSQGAGDQLSTLRLRTKRMIGEGRESNGLYCLDIFSACSAVTSPHQIHCQLGGDGATAAADATKKELLRAIDLRLVAVRQDLFTASARAAAAGFTPETVSELQLFADQFGANRLREACSRFLLLCDGRPNLINPRKATVENCAVRSSCGSDMSVDEDQTGELHSESKQPQCHPHENKHLTGCEADAIPRHLKHSNPFMLREPSKPSSVTFPIQRSRESSVDRDEGMKSDRAGEREKVDETVNQNEPTHTPQLTRRLSVQERINLFENKQKENSGSGNKPVTGKSAELRRLSSDVPSVPSMVEKAVSGSGCNPVVGKSAEIGRLSSDVSSVPAVVERAVLRRWSGASDMSIDSGCEKKETESSLCKLSSSLVSETKPEENKTRKEPELKGVLCSVGDSGSKHQPNPQNLFGVTSDAKDVVETKVGLNLATPLAVSSGWSEDSFESDKLTSARVEGDDCQDQTHGKTQTLSRSSILKAEDDSLNNWETQPQFKSLPDVRAERIGFMDQSRFRGSSTGNERGRFKEEVASETHIVGKKDNAVPLGQFGVEVVGLRGQLDSLYRAPPRTTMNPTQLESGSGVKFQQRPQPQWRSFGQDEEVRKKDMGSSAKEALDLTTQREDFGLQRMQFQKQVSASDQINKAQARKEESSFDNRNSRGVYSGKIFQKGQEDFGTVPTVSAEQIQRVRQSKGNQELNDELKMKANELEKLFAEHKLRGPGEQSSSGWRSKRADLTTEQSASSLYRTQSAELAPAQLPDRNIITEPLRGFRNMSKFTVAPPRNSVDSRRGDYVKQNRSELVLSDDSRGKFYERYMQKRDAKLREDWGSSRAVKEARMKVMQDSFERSRAEMKAKFSGSSDRQDSAFSARRRAERLRSFNARSTMKREQPIDLLQSEDEDLSEFAEKLPLGHCGSFNEISLGRSASKSTQTKKLLHNRSSSSTPRTSAIPVPRLSVKASNSSSGGRRMQPENPLTQSVPNLSDLRKENTKPSSGVSKTTTREQARISARSKSISEEIPLNKGEKPRRSQSLRKSSASPAEFKDMSTLDSEGTVLTPLEFDEEQTEYDLYDKLPKNVESKRKGNGIRPGSGAVIAKMKGSFASESMNNEIESDELAIKLDDSVDTVKDEEGEPEVLTTEDHIYMDTGTLRLSQEYDKLVNSGSESSDAPRSFSKVGSSFVAELPVAVPSTFHPVASVQESPVESPLSWNSRVQHAFAYAHEISDIDASADSPLGSPASWNSHSINQAETDAARMRKKWGSAQKPILVSNASHSHSRKDATKGFKRLLKFRRKGRGTESLVDWVSATTSEGDDDTEDVRDPANCSSEDLRKSRMRILQGHPPDDSFNEREFYSEQVQALNSSIPTSPAKFKLRDNHMSGSSIKAPRSFFSLSTFRSKGNDSKPG